MITKFEHFNEGLLNVSKNRKFPENFYDIYKLNSKEIGAYLNTWFPGKVLYFSELEKNKVKAKRGEIKNDFLVIDEMWTVKKVDEETANHLYHKKYNPIVVSITCPTSGIFKQNDNGEDIFQMRATINSIDDSSYTVWFDNKPINELKDIRTKIMEWINKFDIINGNEFINYCVELGANEDSIDLN